MKCVDCLMYLFDSQSVESKLASDYFSVLGTNLLQSGIEISIAFISVYFNLFCSSQN